jgi:hypothetical protein
MACFLPAKPHPTRTQTVVFGPPLLPIFAAFASVNLLVNSQQPANVVILVSPTILAVRRKPPVGSRTLDQSLKCGGIHDFVHAAAHAGASAPSIPGTPLARGPARKQVISAPAVHTFAVKEVVRVKSRLIPSMAYFSMR